MNYPMGLPAGISSTLADGIAPAVARWAATQERRILKEGQPLEADLLSFAGALGISRPDEIRVMKVKRIPLPVPDWMMKIGRMCRLPVFAPAGMALGKGIYVLPGYESSLPHELVHVMQYEREGGIAGFMNLYLRQCLENGYPGSELEEEARVKGWLPSA